MTDEKPEEKPKQYLLMADQLTMTFLTRLMPGLQFVQVEGMPVKDNDAYQVLVNPLPKPETVKE